MKGLAFPGRVVPPPPCFVTTTLDVKSIRFYYRLRRALVCFKFIARRDLAIRPFGYNRLES